MAARTAHRGVSRRQSERGGDYTIAVLAKGFDLLEVLAAQPSLSLTELSVRAGVHKVTAFRILANFEGRGYVDRNSETGHYRLGFGLMQLGMLVAERLDLRTVARPPLERLWQASGETVNLAVPARDGIVYIDILESAYGLRMAAAVGAQDDYHSTALGKATVAAWPATAQEAFLARTPFVRKTPHTLVDAAALRRELIRTRDRGFALDDQENELGARCVGVPIFNWQRQVVAAISVSGPASRIPLDQVDSLADQLMAAGREISNRLGYQPAGAVRAPQRVGLPVGGADA